MNRQGIKPGINCAQTLTLGVLKWLWRCKLFTGIASEEPFKATLKSVSITYGNPPRATATLTPDEEA